MIRKKKEVRVKMMEKKTQGRRGRQTPSKHIIRFFVSSSTLGPENLLLWTGPFLSKSFFYVLAQPLFSGSHLQCSQNIIYPYPYPVDQTKGRDPSQNIKVPKCPYYGIAVANHDSYIYPDLYLFWHIAFVSPTTYVQKWRLFSYPFIRPLSPWAIVHRIIRHRWSHACFAALPDVVRDRVHVYLDT